jgi:methionine synthase II (cobalamin-independent)
MEVNMEIIQIDDAGWGFPLGGVLIGAVNTKTLKFAYDEIPVVFFKDENFKNKAYLEEAVAVTGHVLKQLGVFNMDKSNVEIHLCPGFIHNRTYEYLTSLGFNVIRKEIGEPLQTLLEDRFRDYIRSLAGKDIYYDPKTMSEDQIRMEYRKVMKYIGDNRLWYRAKTGWDSIQRILGGKYEKAKK